MRAGQVIHTIIVFLCQQVSITYSLDFIDRRVNLIGEHIDYNGYPVLPMAIRQNILLAVQSSADDDELQLRNINHTDYEDFCVKINDFK